ncbi:MAG: UvrD-helicase domain-containing protein [Acidobacteriaceae bacterium]|jgi:ATP-dependent helicase/nuclease subunit A|nr:UvrD-helicase domain-containing protein [Acidobacteriaceae bacterium]
MSETFDARSRAYAVDPARNVVLEASAGTGKTRVLVERYVNLLRAGVEPKHILAITFTRKAAAEMRERIIERLREASRLSEFDRGRWREIHERLGDITISTIDAFCLSLLREFPLEADIDPAFDLADETEAPRLVAESLDRALRICRGRAGGNDSVALVFAQLGERRLRAGLTHLLERRLVAPQALQKFLAKGPHDLTIDIVCARAAGRFADVLGSVSGGLDTWLADGPVHRPEFAMFADDLRRLAGPASVLALETDAGRAWLRQVIDRAKSYFLTTDGRPRTERFQGTGFNGDDCVSDAAWKRHRVAASAMAPSIGEAVLAFRRDLNVVLSRGVWHVFGVTLDIYRRTLDAHALLDFSGVLERAVKLLRDMDEFADSRFRLEARYRHLLVDEFQDTSRAQWELVSYLVRNWGEGFGAAADRFQPSIFVVGDRKQSIYGFRDAEVALLTEAATFIRMLRPDEEPVHAISVSFRARAPLLAFVNDLCAAIDKQPDRHDGFVYGEHDKFPLQQHEDLDDAPALGVAVGVNMTDTAETVAAEIARLFASATVRDRLTGLARPCRPADVAILFRSRNAHREFEKALERRGIGTYVYKGLGFFDADEIQDVVALLGFFADPTSNARAASLLRSRIVRVSDRALASLAPALANALAWSTASPAAVSLSDEDQHALDRARQLVAAWLPRVDRLAPADFLRGLLLDCGYARVLAGPRARQARENLKKLRGIIRRFQNRGYATLARVVSHLDELAVGDESNAAIDAADSVSLMTVHAAKGLEFPIVFIVNMNRGTGTARAPVRVVVPPDGEPSVAVADYQSDADEDVSAREREETKRLLYVALTRARDRLYLSASLADGVLRATRGSLGEVLPAAVKSLFEQAAVATAPQVSWQHHIFVIARR